MSDPLKEQPSSNLTLEGILKAVSEVEQHRIDAVELQFHPSAYSYPYFPHVELSLKPPLEKQNLFISRLAAIPFRETNYMPHGFAILRNMERNPRPGAKHIVFNLSNGRAFEIPADFGPDKYAPNELPVLHRRDGL